MWRNITGVLGEGNIYQQLACSKENKQFAATSISLLCPFPVQKTGVVEVNQFYFCSRLEEFNSGPESAIFQRLSKKHVFKVLLQRSEQPVHDSVHHSTIVFQQDTSVFSFFSRGLGEQPCTHSYVQILVNKEKKKKKRNREILHYITYSPKDQWMDTVRMRVQD